MLWKKVFIVRLPSKPWESETGGGVGKLIGGESNTWQGKGASTDAPEKLESHFAGKKVWSK